MSAAKRARITPPADRIRAVEHALRFDDVMGLVQFHYGCSLRAIDAELKDERDAAIDRLLRASAIVKAADAQRREWRGQRHGENRIGRRRRLKLAVYRQIKEFAPGLVTVPFIVVADWYTAAELDGHYDADADFDDEYDGYNNLDFDLDLILDAVREEHGRYGYFQWQDRRGLKLYHARTLLEACEVAGTEADIYEARIIALRQIKEVTPEIEGGVPGFAIGRDQLEWIMSIIYSEYDDNLRWRLFDRDSLYKSIRGESAKVRHFEAYQLALYGQRMLNEDRPDRYRVDVMSTHHGWDVIEGIRQFAPDLVTVDDCKGPRHGISPWPIIQRLIGATAWTK